MYLLDDKMVSVEMVFAANMEDFEINLNKQLKDIQDSGDYVIDIKYSDDVSGYTGMIVIKAME